MAGSVPSLGCGRGAHTSVNSTRNTWKISCTRIHSRRFHSQSSNSTNTCKGKQRETRLVMRSCESDQVNRRSAIMSIVIQGKSAELVYVYHSNQFYFVLKLNQRLKCRIIWDISIKLTNKSGTMSNLSHSRAEISHYVNMLRTISALSTFTKSPKEIYYVRFTMGT